MVLPVVGAFKERWQFSFFLLKNSLKMQFVK